MQQCIMQSLEVGEKANSVLVAKEAFRDFLENQRGISRRRRKSEYRLGDYDKGMRRAGHHGLEDIMLYGIPENPNDRLKHELKKIKIGKQVTYWTHEDLAEAINIKPESVSAARNLGRNLKVFVYNGKLYSSVAHLARDIHKRQSTASNLAKEVILEWIH